jgi:hypothetical protein
LGESEELEKVKWSLAAPVSSHHHATTTPVPSFFSSSPYFQFFFLPYSVLLAGKDSLSDSVEWKEL